MLRGPLTEEPQAAKLGLLAASAAGSSTASKARSSRPGLLQGGTRKEVSEVRCLQEIRRPVRLESPCEAAASYQWRSYRMNRYHSNKNKSCMPVTSMYDDNDNDPTLTRRAVGYSNGWIASEQKRGSVAQTGATQSEASTETPGAALLRYPRPLVAAWSRLLSTRKNCAFRIPPSSHPVARGARAL